MRLHTRWRSLKARLRRSDSLHGRGFVVLTGLLSGPELGRLVDAAGAPPTSVIERAFSQAGVAVSGFDVIGSHLEIVPPGSPASGRPSTEPGALGPGSRSWLLWVAVDDVIGHNAQMRLVPRPSRNVGNGTARVAPWWSRHRGTVESCLIGVPLRAGDAVLMDASVERAYHPNHTRHPRRALVIQVVTADAADHGPDPSDRDQVPTNLPPTELGDSGYGVLRFLDGSVVEALRRLIDRNVSPPADRFYVSRRDDCGQVARRLDTEIKELLEPLAVGFFPEHRILFASVCSKPPHSNDRVLFHQDLTCTDERVDRSLFMWIPLVDADRSNGGLEIVPGSHRWTCGIRPEQGVDREVATGRHQAEFVARSVEVPLWAGDAVYFDAALLHGSGPNGGDHPRMALVLVLVPLGATVVQFHSDDDGAVSGQLVDDAFFTAHPFATPPSGYPPIDPWAPVVTAEEFERVLQSPPASNQATQP